MTPVAPEVRLGAVGHERQMEKMSDVERLDEAIETWEVFLASAHGCDWDEPVAVAILHVNDAARAYRDLLANGEEWTQQRRDDYAAGYEFARQEFLVNGERGTLIQSKYRGGQRFWTVVMDGDVDGPMTGRFILVRESDYPKEGM